MYLEKFRLAGKTAVVTGGGQGIGLASVEALAEAGAKVVIADRDAKVAAQGQASLKAKGYDVEIVDMDVTSSGQVAAVAAQLVARHGKVDILVNSAGIARLNSAVETPDDEWRAVMDVNVNGLFWCCRAFGRHMVARRTGSIINLGSMSGLIINRPQTAASYMASKGAVHMLTKALATEWAKSGVRVNALAPGYVATDMTLKMRERPELFNTWLDMTPMGRLGEPSEIAAAVVYLASAASTYVTGAILSVDGGYTAW